MEKEVKEKMVSPTNSQNNNNNQPGVITKNQRTLQNYFNDRLIRNEGYLDEIKHSENTRILCISMNGLGPSQKEKID